jgi:hypothetical protein
VQVEKALPPNVLSLKDCSDRRCFDLELTMMCCPSSSSVSRARFITAGAIDLKVCTYVPLGEMNVQTKFWSNLILGLATRGPKPKMQKVL